MQPQDRKRVWVDRFQSKLSQRIGAYLVVFLIVMTNFLFIWKLVEEGPINPVQQFLEMMRVYFPVLVCLLVLVPVMAWDAIRFSHRLVGPLARFCQAMQTIAGGEAVFPIKLREGDFLTDLRNDFNKMLEELQKHGVPVLKPSDPAKEQQQTHKKSA